MRVSSLSSLVPFVGLALAAPTEAQAPQITNPILMVPVDASVKAAVAKAQPPHIMRVNAANLGNGTRFASSHPGAPLTPEEERQIERLRTRIIGNDDRVEVDSPNYPWSAIGRLSTSTGAICSGALVGPRLVSVARHCIDFPEGTTYSFAPNFRDTPRYGSSGVKVIAYLAVPDYLSDNCKRKYDWACT